MVSARDDILHLKLAINMDGWRMDGVLIGKNPIAQNPDLKAITRSRGHRVGKGRKGNVEVCERLDTG